MNDLRQAAEALINHWEAGEYKNCTGDMAGHVQVLREALAQPVDAVNMSQERVDETAKGEHEWKGLDDEIPGLGLVTDEFYNGMIVAEDILRKRNT
jgi:hypothetical protein